MFQEFRRRLRYLLHRDEFAGDLNEEMRLHIEMRAQKLQGQGMAGDDALNAARRQFGNRSAVQDASARPWGWMAWERLLQDFRMGLRTLWKTPGFTLVAVTTLALGLGMNTGVFSIVNALMIRALPYPQAGQLVSLWEEQIARGPDNATVSGAAIGGNRKAQRMSVAPANLMDYRAQCSLFDGLAGVDFSQMNLTGIGDPERIRGESVTANYLPLLGVQPALGRNFLPEEDQEGAPKVIIITHDFWQTRLGGDTRVLDRSLMLDARPHRIVGVLPAGFRSPIQLLVTDRMVYYVPAAYPKELLAQHGDHEINVVGRLKPGVQISSARDQLSAVSDSLARQYPQTNSHVRATIAPLRDDLVRNVHDSLLALLGASGLIVLITCVNVANLLLVRSIRRRHETSVRFALGASRFRVIRQLLAESVLVAAVGCGAGLLIGNLMMRLLISLAPPNTPLLSTVRMDWRVYAVAAAIATITGVVFGFAPAWHASQAQAAEALKTAARNTGGRLQVRWRTILTVSEVALSLILLVGAGLLLRSFVVLMGVDLGFEPDRVLAVNITLPEARYRTPVDRLQFFQKLEERVRALPGVQSVAYANRMPLRGGWGSGTEVDSQPGVTHDVDFQAVNPGYFETIGIPLVQGRLLTDADRSGQPAVAVVNQAFARAYYPGGDPIGHRIRRGSRAPWIEIVGVINDIRRGGKEDQITPGVYLQAAQTELYPVRLADLAVRSADDPKKLVRAIQSQVWAIDKDQPLTNIRTLREIVNVAAAQRWFQTVLLLVFAGVAVTISVIGIFGVLSYVVSQRMNELGIRIALGARPLAILQLVLRQAGVLVAAGVVLGLGGAFALTRYLETLLFQVQKHDWVTFAVATAVLVLVSLVAAWIPARRGAKVDPIVALRYE